MHYGLQLVTGCCKGQSGQEVAQGRRGRRSPTYFNSFTCVSATKLKLFPDVSFAPREGTISKRPRKPWTADARPALAL